MSDVQPAGKRPSDAAGGTRAVATATPVTAAPPPGAGSFTPAPTAPPRFGPYVTGRMLGAGGMGEVWQAHDPALGRDVAVKVLRVRGGNVDRQELLHEARTAARLNHPNVVTVHHVLEADGEVHVVMELMTAGSVADELARRGRLPWREASRVVLDATAGLAAAHAAGLVHRDVKPSNLLRAAHGAIKIGDFGVARAAGAASAGATTTAGQLVGTPAFMSPEQCRGELADARSDIYGLACTFYTLVTGAAAYDADSVAAMVYAHCHRPLPDPRVLAPDLPEPVARVIAKGAAKDPADRYQSADEFGQALERLLAAGDASRPTGDERPNNLPLQLTTFVGREHDCRRVRHLLASHRLATLTGTGGTGKTRLALEVAGQARADFADGVWLVDLAPIADGALVAQAVASVFGVQERAGQPLLAALAGALGEKRACLVLDNCEHLIVAAARVADHLLRACPNLKILATSREPLQVAGEAVAAIAPLPLPPALEADDDPSPADIGRCESVRLFVDRAAAANPAFGVTPDNARAITEICRRLDGIPLAIELAASRTRAVPVEQVAKRLTDRFRLLTGGSRAALPRQQTLRATIDWSYDLLGGAERTLFRRLSVFAGGWTLESAEAVCAFGDLPQGDVLDGLATLVDKSLVNLDQASERYQLLETIRQYANDRVSADAGELAGLRSRHRDHFLSLAEQGEARLGTSDQGDWLARMEPEYDNIRSALDWCAQGGDTSAELKLATALARFRTLQGHYEEGRRRLDEALRRARAAPPSITRADALIHAAAFALDQRDPDAAQRYLDEAVPLCEALADAELTARVYTKLGQRAYQRGDTAGQRQCYERAVAALRSAGSPSKALIWPLMGLGTVLLNEGKYRAGRNALEECLVLAEEVGEGNAQAWALLALARWYNRLRDAVQARQRAQRCIDVAERFGIRTVLMQARGYLGQLLLEKGDHAAAVRHLDQAMEEARQSEDWSSLARIHRLRANAARLAGDLAGARRHVDQALAICRQHGSRDGEAWCLLSGAVPLLIAEGDLLRARTEAEQAVRLFRQREDSFGVCAGLYELGLVHYLLGDHVAAAARVRESIALVWHDVSTTDGAAALKTAAMILIATRRAETGVRLLAATEPTAEGDPGEDSTDAPMERLIGPSRAHVEAAIRAATLALGADEYAEAWDDGRTLTHAQACQLSDEALSNIASAGTT